MKLAPGEDDEDPYGWPCDDAGDGDGDGDDGDAYGYVPPKAERKGITKQKGKTAYSLLFVYNNKKRQFRQNIIYYEESLVEASVNFEC